jgi:hypothetical protein
MQELAGTAHASLATMRPGVGFLLFTTLLTAPVHAQQAPDPVSEPVEDAGSRYRKAPFNVGVQLAPLGGPVGMLGVVGDIALVPQLSVTGGIGKGGWTTQWSAGVRPRLPIGPLTALSVTVAYSHGGFEEFAMDPANSDACRYPDGSWINGDIGIDVRTPSGFTVRPFVGMSQLVDSSAPNAYYGRGGFYPCPEGKRWPSLFYTGVTLGWAF